MACTVAGLRGKIMILSDTCFLVVLPSGARAVYAVQPQHLNPLNGVSLNERAHNYGKQLAVENGGQWYTAGMREIITDARTVALLERCPDTRDTL